MVAATEAAQTRETQWRAGTRPPLVRVGIGLAVREGVTVDLSTVESTRKALLAAGSLTISDSSTGGLSGPNARKVLANLGIADQVKDRLKPTANGQDLIASGEIDLGCESAPSRDPTGINHIRYLPRRSASGPRAN